MNSKWTSEYLLCKSSGNNRFKAESKPADWLLLTSPKSLKEENAIC